MTGIVVSHLLFYFEDLQFMCWRVLDVHVLSATFETLETV